MNRKAVDVLNGAEWAYRESNYAEDQFLLIGNYFIRGEYCGGLVEESNALWLKEVFPDGKDVWWRELCRFDVQSIELVAHLIPEEALEELEKLSPNAPIADDNTYYDLQEKLWQEGIVKRLDEIKSAVMALLPHGPQLEILTALPEGCYLPLFHAWNADDETESTPDFEHFVPRYPITNIATYIIERTAPRLPVDGLGVNRKGTHLLCEASGETETTSVCLARNVKDLTDFWVAEVGGPPDELADFLKDIAEYDWYEEGPYQQVFEIGGLHISDVARVCGQ